MSFEPYECHLPAECYQQAEQILGETPEVREQTIRDIHKWLDQNPHINAHRDTKTILHFLRGAKFRLDKAKIKMTRFYKMRAERIEWYGERNPFEPELVELMDMGVFLPLRIKDDQNRQIFVIRTAAHDPKHHSQNDVFKVGKMILDLVLAMDETISVYGIAAVFDMRGVTLGHALQLPPAAIKRSVESWDCYPCLTKKLEFVNAPFYVSAFLNTFRFFMSNKLKARTFVTGGKSSINVSCLPPELGGTGHSYAELAVYWKDYVQQNAVWFEEDNKYKSTL